jgi:hypothetical protein
MAARIKSKLSMSGWILIAIIIIVVIALPILHFTGVFDLTFLADSFLGVLMWAATDVINGALFTTGVFIGGALTYYAAKKYLIGTKVPITTPYMPAGQTVSNPQTSSDSETVIS